MSIGVAIAVLVGMCSAVLGLRFGFRMALLRSESQ